MATVMHGESPSSADRKRFEAWVDHLFAEATRLPVSFVYGGAPLQAIPQSWSPKRSFRRFGPTVVETAYEGRDPATGLGLRVEVVRYLDFPVAEWTAYLTNYSDRATPRVHDLAAIDATFAGQYGAVVTVMATSTATTGIPGKPPRWKVGRRSR